MDKYIWICDNRKEKESLEWLVEKQILPGVWSPIELTRSPLISL